MVEEVDTTSNKQQQVIIDNIAGLLEFFFSDTNLRSDKFMKNEMKFNDGMIAIQKLLRFNSIKKITTDPALLVKAVETSEKCKTILKLSEDKSSIGRLNKFDIQKIQDNIPLTLFVKGLPTVSEEGDEQNKAKSFAVQIEDVKNLFLEYGDVTLVRLRYKKKLNKSEPTIALGEAFVEYKTPEMAQKAVADLCADKGEPNKKLVLQGETLFIQPMKAWIEEKEKCKEGADAPTKKRSRDIKEEEPVEEKDNLEDGFDIVWKPGCVVSMKGLPDDCDREAIRAAIQDYHEDPKEIYIDFSRGQKTGAIRFETPNDRIIELAEKLKEGKIKISGHAVDTAHVLEGQDEKEYWENFIEFKRKQRKQQTASNRGKPKRGRFVKRH